VERPDRTHRFWWSESARRVWSIAAVLAFSPQSHCSKREPCASSRGDRGRADSLEPGNCTERLAHKIRQLLARRQVVDVHRHERPAVGWKGDACSSSTRTGSDGFRDWSASFSKAPVINELASLYAERT